MSDHLNISINDFDKICRTCTARGEMKNLHEKYIDNSLLIEILVKVTFLQIQENDGLPINICVDCEKQLIQAYNFAQKCSEIDITLRDCLNQNQAVDIAKDPLEIENKVFIRTRPRVKVVESEEKIKEMKNEMKDEMKIEVVEIEDMSPIAIVEEIYFVDEVEVENQVTEVPEVKKPVRKRNKKESYECKKCNEKFPTFHVLKLHRQEMNHPVRSKRIFECHKCKEQFTSFNLLKSHREEMNHPVNSFSKVNCEICNKLMRYRSLKEHMRSHTLEKPYCCEKCGIRFSLKPNYRRHMISRHSEEKPYKCEICGRGFGRTETLKIHQRLHTGEKPYICTFCRKSFTQASSLRAHVAIHEKKDESLGKSVGTDNQCKICDRFFSTKASLRTHRMIHGAKKFLCSACGKRFMNNVQLQSHWKVHSGIRPYSCQVCNKAFRYIASYKTHMFLHTGEKPFACKLCNRAFTQRHHLKYHMRTHSGEKPYVCTVCDKGFALNSNLTVHMRIHTGETPYVCAVCDKGFYDSSSMKKHQKNHGFNK